MEGCGSVFVCFSAIVDVVALEGNQLCGRCGRPPWSASREPTPVALPVYVVARAGSPWPYLLPSRISCVRCYDDRSGQGRRRYGAVRDGQKVGQGRTEAEN